MHRAIQRLLSPLFAAREQLGRERDAAIAERDAAIAEHDVAIAERNVAVAERDAARSAASRLTRRVGQLEDEITKLKARLEEAQRAAKRQAAPFGRRRRKANPRRPGRKRGHPAANRPMPDHIDEEYYVPLCACPHCGGSVDEVIDLEPQVVIDLPEEIKLLVRRFHNQSGRCPHCRRRVRSRHPLQCSTANGAAGIQIGPRALTLGTDLKHRVGVVYRKVSGVFLMMFGLYISPSTLVRADKRISDRCLPSYQWLVEQLRLAGIVHSDETGWHIVSSPKKVWLWVFAVPGLGLTVYAIRASRGSDVPNEILGEDFQGILCVDGWAGYLAVSCPKGQCAAHLLRRCDELLEVQERGAARFPLAVQRLLLQAMALKALTDDLDPAVYADCTAQMHGELTALLGGDIQEPANRRLADHMRRHHDEILRFLDVPLLSPTNNEAEREVRPAVLVRKISAGNRTAQGAIVHERLTSIARTAERNGVRLTDVLPELLRSPDPDHVMPILKHPLPAQPEPTQRPAPRVAPGPTPQLEPHPAPATHEDPHELRARAARRKTPARVPRPRLRHASRSMARCHGATARPPPT